MLVDNPPNLPAMRWGQLVEYGTTMIDMSGLCIEAHTGVQIDSTRLFPDWGGIVTMSR